VPVGFDIRGLKHSSLLRKTSVERLNKYLPLYYRAQLSQKIKDCNQHKPHINRVKHTAESRILTHLRQMQMKSKQRPQKGRAHYLLWPSSIELMI